MDKKDIDLEKILNMYVGHNGSLIPILQATQEIYGYLPKEAMKKIANFLKLPYSEVYGVATFYAQFRLQPRGKHIIRVCSGTACHVRGGDNILKLIEEELGIKSGETTADLRFTIEPVACLGACGLAPVVMIDEQTFGRVTKDKISKLLDQFQ
nr:NADH-quinone oxidoreductase subunit NuoE [Vulcanibacillus modesticaldus]